MVYKIPTAFGTDRRAEELTRVDKKRSDVLAEAARLRSEALIESSRLESEAWALFVSLLIDEMLAKARELGHEGDLRFAVVHYFSGGPNWELATVEGTYFWQLNRRLPNLHQSLEPFKTLFNKELAARGVRLELRSEYSWYSSRLVRI
jgi:hypothetical protein